MNTLIQDVETYCSENGISESRFGELALNDRHFIRQLRAGRDLRMSTLERVRQFMAENGKKNAA